MSNFTQACCDDCWHEKNSLRAPVRVVHKEQEKCCYCGRRTWSGIYIRADPKSVPHPSEET